MGIELYTLTSGELSSLKERFEERLFELSIINEGTMREGSYVLLLDGPLSGTLYPLEGDDVDIRCGDLKAIYLDTSFGQVGFYYGPLEEKASEWYFEMMSVEVFSGSEDIRERFEEAEALRRCELMRSGQETQIIVLKDGVLNDCLYALSKEELQCEASYGRVLIPIRGGVTGETSLLTYVQKDEGSKLWYFEAP